MAQNQKKPPENETLLAIHKLTEAVAALVSVSANNINTNNNKPVPTKRKGGGNKTKKQQPSASSSSCQSQAAQQSKSTVSQAKPSPAPPAQLPKKQPQGRQYQQFLEQLRQTQDKIEKLDMPKILTTTSNTITAPPQPPPVPPVQDNKAPKPKKRGGKKKKATRQSSLEWSLSEQSNFTASITSEKVPSATAATVPLPKQQIKQPQQPQQIKQPQPPKQQKQQGLSSNKIKGMSGNCNGNGNNESAISTKGKGPTDLTNIEHTSRANVNPPPPEPPKNHIIYLTNRAKLAENAKTIAEAVPFRLPYTTNT